VTTEGYVPFRGMRTWYRVAGDRGAAPDGRLPLLLLHGGPGLPSDPFEPLERLSEGRRAVIRYDQIGCGRSDRPRDPHLWTMTTFLDELATVRRALGLGRVHLLGWSWGGMLALEHVLRGGPGIASLVLASAPGSAPLWLAETRRLRDELPPHVRRAMLRFEASHRPRRRRPSARVGRGVSRRRAHWTAVAARRMFGALDSDAAVRAAAWASALRPLRRPAFEVVNGVYIKRHLVRRRPRDLSLSFFRSFAGMNRRVYEAMWGPSEFIATGNLRDWDVTSRLGEIRIPTLITSGRHDEATPVQMSLLRDGIAGSEWVVFEHSAHAALHEEPDRYLGVLERFLDRSDPVAAGRRLGVVEARVR
jgi:L-proline amide hydrolase